MHFKTASYEFSNYALPLILTGCILKQVKILHENALFLHKNFKKFWAGGLSPFADPSPTYPPP